jgi:4-hydroxy-3-methylbut-2-en-1-yl diphosphate synthase IspG/GcpE
MNANEWAGLVLTALSISGILILGLRWFLRVEITNIVKEEIKVVKSELTKNGGSSTKDKIDYIYEKMKRNE